LTYVEAADIEVARTAKMLAPEAIGSGTPNRNTSNGTMKTPPPNPRRAPIPPVKKLIIKAWSVKSGRAILIAIFVAIAKFEGYYPKLQIIKT
jgi:hypothetical protein